MEKDGSHGFGGERPVDNTGGEVFTASERFIPNNLKSMGEGALEGLNSLPMPEDEEMAPEVAKIVREGGEITTEEKIGGTNLTSEGLKVLREAAQRSVPETKGHPDQTEERYKKMRRETLAALGHFAMGGEE